MEFLRTSCWKSSLNKLFYNNFSKIESLLTVMPLAGGQGGRQNLGVQLTLLQPRAGADYAHHNTAGPPLFENPAASLLYFVCIK